MSANIFRQTSAASTNLTRVKVVGANVLGWNIVNTNAAVRFVKLYFFLPGTGGNDAPVVGTTIPDVTIMVPAAGVASPPCVGDWAPSGFSKKGDLWMATTVNAADADATAVAAGDLITSLFIE
jgi:hypothetical protein